MGLSHSHDLDRGFERFNQVYSGPFFVFFLKLKKNYFFLQYLVDWELGFMIYFDFLSIRLF